MGALLEWRPVASGVIRGAMVVSEVAMQTPSPRPSPARGEGVSASAAGAAEALLGREGSERKLGIYLDNDGGMS